MNEDDLEYERLRLAAFYSLLTALDEFRHAQPPLPELESAAAQLRLNLSSDEYPFPQLVSAANFAEDLPIDDIDLLIRAVSATILPESGPLEVDVSDTGEVIARLPDKEWSPPKALVSEIDFDEMPLDFETDDLDLDDWVTLVGMCMNSLSGILIDPDTVVRTAGLDPGSDEGWIKQGAASRALGLWDDFGLLEDGYVTKAGAWVLPRAVARALGGNFDQPH